MNAVLKQRQSYLTAFADRHAPPNGTASTTIYGACLIALRYTHRSPTVPELMNEFGMSRATAFRWIAALKAAKGET